MAGDYNRPSPAEGMGLPHEKDTSGAPALHWALIPSTRG